MQAICLALTGRTKSLLETEDPRIFVRKGSKSAEIKVNFRSKDENMSIKRKISSRGREQCTIFSSAGEEIFQGKWNDATKYIENLFDMRTLFFESILYMSEGDVYRTIREPPGRILLDEIDEALGVRRLQPLRNNLKELIKEFKDEETLLRESFQNARGSVVDRRNLEALSAKLEQMLKQKNKKTLDSDAIESELWELADQLRIKKRLIDDLRFLETQRAEIKREATQIQKIKHRLATVSKDVEEIQRNRIKAEAEMSNLEKILDLVKSVGELRKVRVRCPVCGKSISKDEVEKIRGKTRKRINQMTHDISESFQKLQQLNSEKYEMQSRLNEFQEREIRLKTLEERIESAKDIQTEEREVVAAEKKILALERKRDELKGQLATVDLEIRQLRERITTTEALAQRDMDRIHDDLRSAAKGLFLSKFASVGVEEFIRRQRDSELGGQLYRYVSNVWNSFKKEEGWRVRLDEQGVPLLQVKSDTYSFSSLSGGEKTALLVVTRTALSRLLAAEAGFLLLDEPLEHLDSRNRRSLLRFLKDAYVEKIVGQLIVTTVEESLLNRFMDLDYVNIIPLESVATAG